MKLIQPGYVASTGIEAFPLLSDPVTRPDASVRVMKQPDAADEAEDKKERAAARAYSILVVVECSEQARPKLRDAIIEAMLWAQKQDPA